MPRQYEEEKHHEEPKYHQEEEEKKIGKKVGDRDDDKFFRPRHDMDDEISFERAHGGHFS